jgi:hypothetical protein
MGVEEGGQRTRVDLRWVNETVGTRRANAAGSVMPCTFTPAIDCSPPMRRSLRATSWCAIAPIAAWISRVRGRNPGVVGVCAAPIPRPNHWRYSIAPSTPAWPSNDWVPVSNLPGVSSATTVSL